ncbi:MAG: phytanoyl-CoA dioxygenase family protein [bacterium]
MSPHTLSSLDRSVTTCIPEIAALPSDEQIAAFRRAGVGVVRSLLDVAEIEHLMDAFMKAAADGPIENLSETSITTKPGAGDDPLVRYPRFLHPHRRDDLEIGPLSLRYMLDPRINRVLSALLGEPILAAQSMFYFKPPGARGQGLHQDNQPLAVHPGTCLAAWIPLDRCDEENGALKVVPGSGPLDLLCDAETEERADIFFTGRSIKLPGNVMPVIAELDRGDVLLFNGQLIHGSYPNRSPDRWRRTLIFHYAPASCEEIAGFYHPLLDMNGNVVERRKSPAGGPCGRFTERH